MSSKFREQFGSVHQVMHGKTVRAGGEVGFDRLRKVMARVERFEVFRVQIRKEERLSAVAGEFHDLVQNDVVPRAEACGKDDLFRTGKGSKGIGCRFCIVVEEADLGHGALHVGIFENKKVFVRGADHRSQRGKSQNELVVAGGFRCDDRERAERSEARLAFRLMLVARNGFSALVDDGNLDFDIFEAGLVQQGKREGNFGLRSADRFKTGDEQAGWGRCRLHEGIEALRLAVFVHETAEVRTEISPLVEHKAGNERVALDGVDLRELTLQGQAVRVGVERF